MCTMLCFKTVCDIPGARVTFDSIMSKDIILQLQDGHKYVFKQFQNGLYYYDTLNVDHNQYSKADLTDYLQLQTAKSNKQYFTTAEIKGADMSRKYQEYFFYPGTKTFQHYVRNNLINNCSITTDDVTRAELIYGPPVPYIEETMTRSTPPIHNKIEKIPLPPAVAQHHLKNFFSNRFLLRQW